MHDKLKAFVEETTAKLLESLPPEKRLEGLSAQQVARGLPPETLAALARLLKANGRSADPDGATGEGKKDGVD